VIRANGCTTGGNCATRAATSTLGLMASRLDKRQSAPSKQLSIPLVSLPPLSLVPLLLKTGIPCYNQLGVYLGSTVIGYSLPRLKSVMFWMGTLMIIFGGRNSTHVKRVEEKYRFNKRIAAP